MQHSTNTAGGVSPAPLQLAAVILVLLLVAPSVIGMASSYHLSPLLSLPLVVPRMCWYKGPQKVITSDDKSSMQSLTQPIMQSAINHQGFLTDQTWIQMSTPINNSYPDLLLMALFFLGQGLTFLAVMGWIVRRSPDTVQNIRLRCALFRVSEMNVTEHSQRNKFIFTFDLLCCRNFLKKEKYCLSIISPQR